MSLSPMYGPGAAPAAAASAGTAAAANAGASNPAQQVLGQDDFLKLMIAELQNQDPSQATNSTQFVAQLAQFSALEQMTNVAQAVTKLDSDLTALSQQTLLTQGAALIGKQVSGTDAGGQTVQGTVSQVTMQNGQVELQVGSQTLTLAQVDRIDNAAGTPA
ncbi:Flagellar hook capping protein - N-terminal region [Acididesulfobacillus acetoxydans]|uniref:Flagellar hook capping protein - N-terminal region n=1 Tax=Acididesulfobacillus acetoxydans TaxID=1561005 RepID=A0A8S0WQY4_9FIRM|nr:flagellar hook capping FlgD N-terminal domain-containing protein [Acididesulfobacillus acetoxydans]CAA7602944.1 Flagellar hook capping protein - N-terminal region [Acididesulfobacillus acetoxydans]CEJ05826.1 Flagellar hook capping protein-N-terminal region [Acididesulfobacillus acetoxydans]